MPSIVDSRLDGVLEDGRDRENVRGEDGAARVEGADGNGKETGSVC